jgi:hypothetical protein
MQDSRSTFGSALTQVQTSIETLATVATSLKISDLKNSKRKRLRGKCK